LNAHHRGCTSIVGLFSEWTDQLPLTSSTICATNKVYRD